MFELQTGDKISSYPFLWTLDKISSYPLDLLEACTQADIIGPERPLTGQAQWVAPTLRVHGPELLGPCTHWLGKPILVVPTSAVGRPLAQILQAWTNFKSAPISQNKIAPISQNEIVPISQNAVISKITFLIN